MILSLVEGVKCPCLLSAHGVIDSSFARLVPTKSASLYVFVPSHVNGNGVDDYVLIDNSLLPVLSKTSHICEVSCGKH